MTEVIVARTILSRWSVLAFIVFFLWVAVPEVGWRRALRFLAVASVLQLAAELSSTRWGIPYGKYTYSGETHGKEIFISNVPLFVPLGFGVVVWGGRTLAAAWRTPRSPWSLVVPGAVAAALLDLIVDPMTVRGGTWYLGNLYRYEASGGWFGVPWTNFGGWVLMSGLILLTDAVLEPSFIPPPPSRRALALPIATAAYIILLALWTHHWAIALSSLALSAAVFGVAVAPTFRMGLTPDAEPVD